MNVTSDNAQISDYYKRSNWLYKYFWYSSRSLAMHYGFWKPETQNHDEALINQYKSIIEKAQIVKGMRVLDAGCGVGGGAIYIAEKTGASVVGISISLEQINWAEQNRNKFKTLGATFKHQDFTKTSFPDNYFDVVYGIESVCHAHPKKLFLDEAFRILKPGGSLVISDGYCKYKPKDVSEKSIVDKFCHGWRLRELITLADMSLAIRKSKFKLIKTEDKTSEVWKSLDKMRILTYLAKPIIWISNIIPLPIFEIVADNAESMNMSRKGVGLGLLGYFTHVARKPK